MFLSCPNGSEKLPTALLPVFVSQILLVLEKREIVLVEMHLIISASAGLLQANFLLNTKNELVQEIDDFTFLCSNFFLRHYYNDYYFAFKLNHSLNFFRFLIFRSSLQTWFHPEK